MNEKLQNVWKSFCACTGNTEPEIISYAMSVRRRDSSSYPMSLLQRTRRYPNFLRQLLPIYCSLFFCFESTTIAVKTQYTHEIVIKTIAINGYQNDRIHNDK